MEFEIVPSGENTVSIVLRNRAATLKGIHLVVEISGGELVRVERGSVFGSASQLFFGTIPSSAGDADICISALGVDVPLEASGEIAHLVLKSSSESVATVRIKVLDLRNLDNEKYEIVVTEEVETPFVPAATALMQNFPNPFNPSTTLAFDVAQAGNVTIQIYDVSGRLVATLLDSHKEIGRSPGRVERQEYERHARAERHLLLPDEAPPASKRRKRRYGAIAERGRDAGGARLRVPRGLVLLRIGASSIIRTARAVSFALLLFATLAAPILCGPATPAWDYPRPRALR